MAIKAAIMVAKDIRKGSVESGADESRIRRLEDEPRELISEVRRLRYRNDLLEKRLNAHSRTLSQHNLALNADERLHLAEARIAGLENSTSWRITAPLRWLAKLLWVTRSSPN